MVNPTQGFYPSPELKEASETLTMPFSDTGTPDIIKWQLDTSNHLLDIEKRLGGMERRWNGKKNDYEYVKVNKPLINQLGISRVMGILRSVMDVNTILSDYKKEEAYAVVVEVVSAVLDVLYLERANFEVKKSDLTTIRSIVENGVKSTIFRSVEGVTMDYLRGSHKSMMQVVNNPNQGGIFSRLGSVFGGGRR